MEHDSSRRKLLKVGLMLPAAGLVSSHGFDAFSKTQDDIPYRTLDKTDLKVSRIKSGMCVAAIVLPVLLNARTVSMFITG